MTGPVRLGRAPCDRWLTWPETDICIILQLHQTRLFEADSVGARRSTADCVPLSSYTVTTIGSICDTTETSQPLAMHTVFAGVNPSLLTFPFTLTLLLF